jgi:hypothetical protein
MSATGVSARVIGEHLGISHCQVLKWRTGIRPIPARHIPKILALLSSPPARTKPRWKPPPNWPRGSKGAQDKAARAKRRTRTPKAPLSMMVDPQDVDRRHQPAHQRAVERIEAETRQEGFSSLVAMLAGIMAPAAAAMGMPTPIIDEPRSAASSHPIAASKQPSGALAGVPASTPRQAADDARGAITSGRAHCRR